MRAIIPLILTAALSGLLLSSAQAQTTNQARPSRPARTDGRQGAAIERAPDALERVSWRTRTHVGDERLTRWKFGIAARPLPNLTFKEAVVRADAAGVNFIEGSSTQKVSPEIQKNLDHNLTAEERTAARGFMGSIKMLAYRVDDLGVNAESRRKVFEFAREMGVEMIVAPVDAAAIAEVDGLADEFEIKVAVAGRPETIMKSLEGRGKRLGAAADTGLSMEHGRTPAALLAVVKDKLSYVSLRDRTAVGADARNVMLGKGAGNFMAFFNELDRLNVRPLILTLDTTGLVNQPGDLFAAVAAFEDTVQPAYGVHFTEWSRSRPAPRLDIAPEAKEKIVAAIPKKPYATPKKKRKLLVIESLHGMYHSTIPHCNVMLQEMGRLTGAWETELSNDLNNLKYPKIKEYDAVFINSAVNEMFPDPAVREGLARFVKEGGGMGGIHGTPWASRNWQEFADMIGSRSAPHRIEQGVMHVYDAASPLMKPFDGKDLKLREEYYRFEHEGYNRLMWENVRVLLTVDLEVPQTSPWNGYKRPDNIYPVSWIRSYGKGRTFYCSLGHIPETFMTPEVAGHLLASMQFLLGDLEADTTPNPRAPAP